MAEVLSDASSGSAPSLPHRSDGCRFEKIRAPGESASATVSAGAGRAAEESLQEDNNPESQVEGVEKSALREKAAMEHERAVTGAEEAVREATAQLAAVRDGPSVRGEADKSAKAAPPKKPKLTFIMGQGRSARVSTGVPSQTGGPIASDATSGQFLGVSISESALVSGASLSRKDDIQIVEGRGDGNEKLLASVSGPALSGDQTGRSASLFQHSRRSLAAGHIGLHGVPAPLAAGQRVSLPSSIDLTGTGAFPRFAPSGMATGAPSPGSVALPAVLEVELPAPPGTVYPVPEGFDDKEVLT